MNQPAGLVREVSPSILDLMRCLSCGRPLMGEERCLECGRTYPCRDGIIEAMRAALRSQQDQRRIL